MVVLANISRTKSFIYVILVLLFLNLAVLAFIYFRYLNDVTRPEIAPVQVNLQFLTLELRHNIWDIIFETNKIMKHYTNRFYEWSCSSWPSYMNPQKI